MIYFSSQESAVADCSEIVNCNRVDEDIDVPWFVNLLKTETYFNGNIRGKSLLLCSSKVKTSNPTFAI